MCCYFIQSNQGRSPGQVALSREGWEVRVRHEQNPGARGSRQHERQVQGPESRVIFGMSGRQQRPPPPLAGMMWGESGKNLPEGLHGILHFVWLDHSFFFSPSSSLHHWLHHHNPCTALIISPECILPKFLWLYGYIQTHKGCVLSFS